MSSSVAAVCRALAGSATTVVMADGSRISGTIVAVDDKLSVVLKDARDPAFAGTPLERTASDTLRIIRGDMVVGVFCE